jgi:hypothetical protein
MHETTYHLLTKCNYTETVWNIVAVQVGLPDYNSMVAKGGPVQWVRHILQFGSKKRRENI